MKTKKITLTELRSLVKNIIKEENTKNKRVIKENLDNNRDFEFELLMAIDEILDKEESTNGELSILYYVEDASDKILNILMNRFDSMGWDEEKAINWFNNDSKLEKLARNGAVNFLKKLTPEEISTAKKNRDSGNVQHVRSLKNYRNK
jgi:hypothetical protein